MVARMRIGVVMLAVALSVVTSAACGKRASGAVERPTTTLLVDNQSSFEMTIYVLRSSERVRLGTARAINETRLRIPAGMVFGPTLLRFQADPIGARRTPTSSEILVNEGDVVTLRIPPL